MNGSCNLTEEQEEYTSLVDAGYCTIPEWVIILEIIFLGSVTVGSVVLNSYVLLLILKFKFLRYRAIIVTISVVVADLLLGFTYILPAVINASVRDWVFGGKLGCIIVGYIVFYLLGVRWMVMGLIALDRFFYILFPFSYVRPSLFAGLDYWTGILDWTTGLQFLYLEFNFYGSSFNEY